MVDLLLTFRQATAEDGPGIVSLVNSAYRGESSRAGWTTEADFLGGQRTDMDEVSNILADPNAIFLLCFNGDKLIASAHLERAGNAAHFGMFAVTPGLQNSGIGKRFMEEAEALAAKQWHCDKMQMAVITLRQPLIEFYERRGYRRTGQFKEFPRSEKFGIPKVSGLQLEVLEKTL